MPSAEIDVGEYRPATTQPDGLKAQPLAPLSNLCRVEPYQPQVAQPLDNAADHGGLTATRRAGQKQVRNRRAHFTGSSIHWRQHGPQRWSSSRRYTWSISSCSDRPFI